MRKLSVLLLNLLMAGGYWYAFYRVCVHINVTQDWSWLLILAIPAMLIFALMMWLGKTFAEEISRSDEEARLLKEISELSFGAPVAIACMITFFAILGKYFSTDDLVTLGNLMPD